MSIKNRINTSKSQIHDELDKAYEFKKKLDYDKKFGLLVSYVTRIKLLEDLIKCFKLIKHDKQHEIKYIIDRIRKRIKLHLHQIYKLESNTGGYEQNRTFFYDCLRVILSFMYEKIKLCNNK
tara:strand:+ start:87 stop:452 length:366 start_codon:yes stop_codon:yes gene_type:complete